MDNLFHFIGAVLVRGMVPYLITALILLAAILAIILIIIGGPRE